MDPEGRAFLVWTTTPWTLPSNQFSAVKPALEYSVVAVEGAERKLVMASALVEEIAAKVEGRGVSDVAQVFLRMVPENIFKAAVEGQMLGIIFFAILFGYFMTHLAHQYAEPLFNFWNGVFHVMMSMTEWIMKFAPIGVFGLVAEVMATAGFSAAKPLAIFAICVFLALVFHAFATLPAMLRFIGKVKPYKTMAGASPAMLTAFSTASSSATLPVTMDSLEDNIGVSNKVSSFVLPLGATVNMNGTALYECAAAIFLAQAYGLELTFGVQFSMDEIEGIETFGQLDILERVCVSWR